ASRRRHTSSKRDWSSDVCSSDLMGAVSGLFLIGYGAFRIIVEFFRQPDAQFTGAWVQYISMGQILSIPMIVAGVIMMVWAYRRKLGRASCRGSAEAQCRASTQFM